MKNHIGANKGIRCLIVAIGAMAVLTISGLVPVLAAQEEEEIFSPYLASKRAPKWDESRFAALASPLADASDAARFAETVRTGILLVKNGQYAKAVELLEPYRTKDSFVVLHALGVAYVRMNRNQEAYDSLIRAHTLRPNIPGPLLPAALACAKMARRCYDYRDLALEYKKLGGRFIRLADRIAYHVPYTLRKG